MALVLLSTICAALCAALSVALKPTGDYSQGPIPLSDTGTFWHRVDLKTRTAFLALIVNDSAALSPGRPSWLGMGISEPTSGGMLGADVVTAEFAKADDACSIADRYVPAVAFPLTESPGAFPNKDDCQDDGSWVLVHCERDVAAGEMLFEVRRSLDAHDTQDRDIVEGVNHIIFAYGDNFGYHKSNRASTQVVLYEDGVDPDEPVKAEPPLPDDVDGFIDVLATNYTVPSNKETIYACTSKVFELPKGQERMIVAAEHVLNGDIDMVHHLTVYLCSKEGYAEKTKNTVECTTDSAEGSVSGPLGNPEAGCSTFVYGYAKGVGRSVVPREAGFRVKKDRAFVVVESHYDNPEDIVGNVDSSGVRLYYTNTMRDNDAGSLLIGDSVVDRLGNVVLSDFVYQHTCPSGCTEKFKEPINIFGSTLHMHTVGREIYTNKFSKNGTFIENINKVNFWSDSFQKVVLFDPPRTLGPGEQLQTSCKYDTSKRPGTIFGLATQDEMCMDFIGYYPVQRDPVTDDEVNICSWGRNEKNETYTYCGDQGKPFTNNSILFEPNPALNDTVGAPTTFGEDPGTCAVVTPSVVPSQPTSTPVVSAKPAASEAAGGAGQTPAPGSTPSGAAASPTPSDSVEASPGENGGADGDDDDNVCFPGSGTVSLRDGSSKRMDEVAIGDEVQVGPNDFSEVFMFTHQDSQAKYEFVRLSTRDGASVSLTGSHYLYVNGALTMAGRAKIGDSLTLADGRQSAIVAVERHSSRGLYNPQTIHGDVIVDGVRASTYTRSVTPEAAHGLLAPIRLLYRVVGLDASAIVV